jgi:hypothetical protein
MTLGMLLQHASFPFNKLEGWIIRQSANDFIKGGPWGYPSRDRAVRVDIYDARHGITTTGRIAQVEKRKQASRMIAVPVRYDHTLHPVEGYMHGRYVPDERFGIGSGVEEGKMGTLPVNLSFLSSLKGQDGLVKQQESIR